MTDHPIFTVGHSNHSCIAFVRESPGAGPER